MKLAIKTCTLDMPYTDMLDFCAAQGISCLEIGTGNWSAAPISTWRGSSPPKPPGHAGGMNRGGGAWSSAP